MTKETKATKPVRIQLSRRKGWRMPPNTVKVDRSTPWGNPFVVGENGMRRVDAVAYFRYLIAGMVCISISSESIAKQRAFHKYACGHLKDLRGKNLACWCPLDSKDCHADVLLALANGEDIGPLRPLKTIG